MAQTVVFNKAVLANDFNRLPNTRRIVAAENKYAVAVDLYATTDMPLCGVAEMCGVKARALGAYIARYHRHLLYARYCIGIGNAPTFNIAPRKGNPAGQMSPNSCTTRHDPPPRQSHDASSRHCQ